jgi:hypothetical protein
MDIATILPLNTLGGSIDNGRGVCDILFKIYMRRHFVE